jgi:hypothetical protein
VGAKTSNLTGIRRCFFGEEVIGKEKAKKKEKWLAKVQIGENKRNR